MFCSIKRLFNNGSKSPAEVLRYGPVIIDVRTKDEFNEGHIAGSKNIPLDEIKLQVDMIRQWNKPVVTVCRSGHRSAIAMKMLKAAGLEVYNGGAWSALKNRIND